MVPVEVEQPLEVTLLFVLRFKNGVKRQKPTFVVISATYEKEGGELIPLEIESVLKKYGDKALPRQS